MAEKLCLKWNDFQDNVITSFGSLRDDTNFSDVTLVCEDGQQFQSHKIILVSSSPFFKNLLTRNMHPHPLIYMRGVKSEDLSAIMDFLYQGEANIKTYWPAGGGRGQNPENTAQGNSGQNAIRP